MRTPINERIINIEGVHNIRDLGGIEGLDGRRIKPDRLIRSSRLIQMGEDGFRYFKKINLTTILDLRTAYEAAKRPNPVIEGVKTYSISVLDEKADTTNATYGMLAGAVSEEEALVKLLMGGFTMSSVYLDFVKQEHAMAGMKQALELIAAQPEGEAILWHCNGGKDRTGTLTLFLLTILGADRTDIWEDFEQTNVSFADEIARLKAVAAQYTDDERVSREMESIAGVSRANMQGALDFIDAQYGSLMNYIRNAIGITDETIETIRNKYLEGGQENE